MTFVSTVPAGQSFENARHRWRDQGLANGLTPVGKPIVYRHGPVLRVEGEVRALATL